MRPLAVDISRWQANYADDMIDEGFAKPLMVIIKCATGQYNHFDKSYWNHTQFMAQWDSVKDFTIKAGYHWIETETAHTINEHITAALGALEYVDGLFLDFEGYANVINTESVYKLREIARGIKEHTNKPIGIYSSKSIFKDFVQPYFGDELLDYLLWGAGGALYNAKIATQPPNNYHIWTLDGVPLFLEQFSADGNALADEFDFGVSESGSIDLNLINATEQECIDLFIGGAEEKRWLDLTLQDKDYLLKSLCKRAGWVDEQDNTLMP